MAGCHRGRRSVSHGSLSPLIAIPSAAEMAEATFALALRGRKLRLTIRNFCTPRPPRPLSQRLQPALMTTATGLCGFGWAGSTFNCKLPLCVTSTWLCKGALCGFGCWQAGLLPCRRRWYLSALVVAVSGSSSGMAVLYSQVKSGSAS